MKLTIYKLKLYVVLLFIAGNVSAGKIYKWVDEKGNVHYSSNTQFAKPKGEVKDLNVEGAKKKQK